MVRLVRKDVGESRKRGGEEEGSLADNGLGPAKSSRLRDRGDSWQGGGGY